MIPQIKISGRIAKAGKPESELSSGDLLSSLSGLEGDRDRAMAHRTRRVVMTSVGVLKERDQHKIRARHNALAMTLIVLLLVAPLFWEAFDGLIAGEHLADPGSQLSLLGFILCPALLAAALVAGWLRKR